MQNLFLTEDDTFEVNIYVAIDENKVIYCDKKREGVNFLIGDKELEIQKYSIVFKKPSFGDIVSITDTIMKNSNSETGQANPLSVKLNTMSFLLRDWDFTNNTNVKMPAIRENLEKLDPIIVACIGIQVDDFLVKDDSEEKSS